MKTKVTFGIINYNRLYYLKSCAESLMESVSDYENVEFICIDDNSKEPGTKQYLKSLKKRGWTVINQEEYRKTRKLITDEYNDTTHMNAFSDALNIILRKSTGELFIPLQGDIEFVRKGWLSCYVKLFEERENVGCVLLDAQRKVRLENSTFTDKFVTEENVFAVDLKRKVSGAGDVVYRTSAIKDLGGWNSSPESNARGYTATSETDFTYRIHTEYGNFIKVYVPFKPPAIVILTDKSGTNARVRGGKRYGNYWQAKDNKYYRWVKSKWENKDRPQSIEELASTNGNWEMPIDEEGNLIKLGIDVNLLDYEVV